MWKYILNLFAISSKNILKKTDIEICQISLSNQKNLEILLNDEGFYYFWSGK